MQLPKIMAHGTSEEKLLLPNELMIVKLNDNEKVLPFSQISDTTDASETDFYSTKQCKGDGSATSEESIANDVAFKKPEVLVGPRRTQAVRKLSKIVQKTEKHTPEKNVDHSNEDKEPPLRKPDPPIPYVEPSWSGKPKECYKIEILKSGVIVDTISLNEQSFHIVGRLPLCDISLAHPTISRYHAVLQYRLEEDSAHQRGLYVYDLGSTHGTYWNGSRIKPNIYVRVRGGHILRFGCSQRRYILQAPLEDQEEESQYSLTELKEMRASHLQKLEMGNERVDVKRDIENDGINWGMGEDADEETDLQENPYASITDEDLTLEDPKKTLRGWFEREGYDLRYQTDEKGIGQFLCWVDLPLEDVVGHSIRAEALVKGKKKEAVVQCALEACKILDKHGLLRQANHEARKRKTRNWEAEDYYDSDEDNFLDRTGSVEKKREHRMRLAGKLEEKVETYDTLLKKHEQVTQRILHLSTTIKNWQDASTANNEPAVEDELDAFMSSLGSFALTKSDVTKMRLELQNLRKEEADLIRLLNLTRPANLPALSCRDLPDHRLHETVIPTHDAPKLDSDAKKIMGSTTHRRKEKERNHPEDVNTSVNTFARSGLEEEMDSDDNDGSVLKSHVAMHVEDCDRQQSNDTLAKKNDSSIGKSTNQPKRQLITTKKHREKQQKIRCDPDIYGDNYSTWVPPSDQCGDGKTNLNEKYGY